MNQQLINAFTDAALHLKHKVEHCGWEQFSSNYLREYVRCRYGLQFSNSLSPEILDEVVRQNPELSGWIVTAARKAA